MLTVRVKMHIIPIAYQMISKINSVIFTIFEMRTVEFFFLFPPDENTKSPEGKGYAQGHKAIRWQSWDFNPGSHAHTTRLYSLILTHQKHHLQKYRHHVQNFLL